MNRALARLRVLALLGALVVAATVLDGAAASAAPSRPSSIARTGYNVPGWCSLAGGLQTDVPGDVTSLRLTVSPASPHAGHKVHVRASVLQPQSTPAGQYYPAGFLRGEVVVTVGAKKHTLVGPVNPRPVTGPMFARGWTAKAAFKAPAKGKYRVLVQRIAYNVYGGGVRGGWSKPYGGFDLVCSGGMDPAATATPYLLPRLTWTVRKHR